MISIIIVYNDANIQDSLTVSSLRRQSKEYELILVENIDNQNFKSAAAALNAGARRSTGDYLMFVHQDVDLLDENFLERVADFLKQLDSLGVAGVAGMSESGTNYCDRQRNLIYHGVPKRIWGKELQSCERVQTLDECLLIIPSNVFEQLKFDDKSCDNWHLYGVDYCLTVAEQGLSAYVLPLPIYHQSAGDSAKIKRNLFWGSLSGDYFRSFEAVRRKHKNSVNFIHTTCESFDTKYPIFLQRGFRVVRRFVGL